MAEKAKHKELHEELEHDELTEAAVAALQFLKRHRNAIMNVVIGILVVVILLSYSRGARQRAILDSSRQLAQASMRAASAEELGAGEEARALVAAELRRVAETFPKLRAGRSARLRLAQTLFESGDYDAAKAEFDTFVAQYPDDPYMPLALEGSALCLEAKGEYEAALSALRSALAAHPEAFNALEMRLDEARCLEALGRLEEAVAVYEEIAEARPGTAYEAFARERADRLRPAAALVELPPPPEAIAPPGPGETGEGGAAPSETQ